MASVLVVDDEQMLCELLRATLSRLGYEVLIASGGREGLDQYRRHRPQVTVLDLYMPDMNGVEVLRQIRHVDPQASVVMLTGGGTDALENQARTLGVTDLLQKGSSLDVLIGSLARIMQAAQPTNQPTNQPRNFRGSGSAPCP